MRSQWERLDAETRAVAGQVVRYAVSGLLITLGVAFTYWALTEWAGIAPLVSNTLAFVGWTFVSYLTHSRFTFRDHGSRDRPMVRQARFFVTNVAGYLTNQFWVWWLVHHLDGDTWWPTLPMIFVTPWLTFFLQRRWVYA